MSECFRILIAPLIFAVAWTSTDLIRADDKEAVRYFETKVRPLLAQHCFKCHGREEQKSDLRLDRRTHFLQGGTGGPIVEPGKPEESVLIEAVKWEGYEMPPSGKLPDDEIAILETWVRNGAFWPEQAGETRADSGPFTAEDRNWWAFQPVTRPETPAIAQQAIVHNPIDNFIQAKLGQNDISPSPPAERRVLIRRIYFDMLGVPPTVEEVESFVADERDNAYERLVDRVLADHRYGERWASHWLDLVRYADSDGYRQDAYRPLAWRYRDYVIRSLNEDKSYKRFLQEQLAGDEIAPDDHDALTATYFLRAGVYEYNSRDAEGQQVLIADELTDTVGDVFLGMGVACAHCHNHKFDPILRDDYYRLQAFFKPLVWKDEHLLATDEERKAYQLALAQWETKHRELLDKINAIEAPVRESRRKKAVSMFPTEVQEMYWKPREERTTYENQIFYLVEKQVQFEYDRLANAIPKKQKKEWEALKKELQAFLKNKPKEPPMADIAVDAQGEISPTRIPGDRLERDIAPGFLTILDPQPAKMNDAEVVADTSGRRTTLAQWLTQDDNPLSSRVIVNRVWQYHFGVGLSANASDFGRLGEPPSHPELLDWLTSEFIDNDWRLKPLHRQILLSGTYRQSSLTAASEKALLVDPKNRLLWRFPAHRLDAEQIRDAMLAASGELKERTGGPAASSNDTVRSGYTKKMRNSPDALLESFDAPGGFSSVALRNSTTTATQSLLMINGDWTLKRAEAMGKRLHREFGSNLTGLIQHSYEECYGRPPQQQELDAAISFFERQVKYNRELARQQQAKIPSSALLDEPQMQRWNTAFNISDKTPHQILTLPDTTSLPSHNFTIEAIVFQRSLFPNASVRTIAAHWNGQSTSAGWNFGVTSEQSSYRPRNLILQLIGDDKQGNRKYEVIASNLRIPSDKPYYVGAAVDFDAGTVTFYTRDMSYDESELEMVVVPHSIVGNCHDDRLHFSIGGRDKKSDSHNWDGLLDDVRLTRTALTETDQIMINTPNDLVTDETVGMWRFVRSAPRGPLAELTHEPQDLELSSGSDSRSADLIALIDFCHVLLNSSEFQFVD
ncbi:DUF1553 domain-containing protein [Blastopirellula sp. J2-11]|uniref:DUF1549 domain-containing protein n=1 Tax=Blastopirellula sp. J2-11 TaxID=2943192 RepID=UPI0021C99A32|nr:DUF1549 domain-containing protein [Blastopirellula sp. J2-11]UUO07756.1 DUF1553 domain-containing protein [Blastopirellula sp. J2-11]